MMSIRGKNAAGQKDIARESCLHPDLSDLSQLTKHRTDVPSTSAGWDYIPTVYVVIFLKNGSQYFHVKWVCVSLSCDNGLFIHP